MQAAEHFKATLKEHHKQFEAELKQLQEAKVCSCMCDEMMYTPLEAAGLVQLFWNSCSL